MNLQKKGEKSTYVNDSSYEDEPTGAQSSYAKAVIQQCTDLQKLSVSTYWGFTKADIGRDPAGFFKVLEQTMKEAIDWQNSKGSKALYHKIKYNN
jgi:hypothetical protein